MIHLGRRSTSLLHLIGVVLHTLVSGGSFFGLAHHFPRLNHDDGVSGSDFDCSSTFFVCKSFSPIHGRFGTTLFDVSLLFFPKAVGFWLVVGHGGSHLVYAFIHM
jgi:hypothetical protein